MTIPAMLPEAVVRELVRDITTEQVLDAVLDPERVAIALQSVFAGYTIPVGGANVDVLIPLSKEFVRQLRQGIDTEPPAGG